MSLGPRPASGERARHALEQAHGTQVHVLVEFAANRDQEAPQRDVIGDARKADGAEIHRLELSELIEPVLRHHPAGSRVRLAAPVERRPREIEAESPPRRLEHTHAFRKDFLADSIARNHGNPMSHLSPPGFESCGGAARGGSNSNLEAAVAPEQMEKSEVTDFTGGTETRRATARASGKRSRNAGDAGPAARLMDRAKGRS